MKLLKLAFLSLLILGCKIEKKNNTDSSKIENDSITVKKEKRDTGKEKDNNQIKVTNIKSLDFDLSEILNYEMIGLSINEEEKEVKKRYSFDVSGGCYSCDLANIKFNKTEITFTNICESSEKKVLKIKEIRKNNNEYYISFYQGEKETTLSITKVEDLPIFNIILNEGYESLENFRINNFYILEKDLVKLETHDCGDFEG